MATPANTFKPSVQVQARVISYYQYCANLMRARYNIREQLLEKDRSYMREVDNTVEQYKARRANKAGDPTKFQNVIIPVVMPQVENAVTYQTSVFLQGYPMFGVVSDPANSEAALQMDTVIGEQQVKGGWVQEYQKAFRNGFKYNLLGTEVSWESETTFAISNSTDTSGSDLVEVIWQGNKVKNIDLYNAIFDPTVKPSEIATRGEFAGYSELYRRVALIKKLNSIPNSFNKIQALQSSFGGPTGNIDSPHNYYFPQLNNDALIRPDFLSGTNWLAVVGLAGGGARDSMRQYVSGAYQVTTLYAQIIPSDFGITGVSGVNVPQIWKFVIVNGSVVVAMERQTNAHGYLPILFAQPYDDDLGYQTKSLAANVGPIQEITSALANSSIASRRRAVADRMLYDPSRISKSAIDNSSPTARIPVKASAFGDDLAKAVYPIPFRDDLFQANGAEMSQFLGLANQISGMNPARQGQFVKGNKTRTEYMDVMQNSNGRDQTVAMSMEASLFTPSKEIIKANILQFQGGVQLYNREVQQPVQIDPLALRKAMLVFKIADGLSPADKLIDADSLTVAFQTIQSVPRLQSDYNVAAMFSYLMKARGARLQPFEKPPEQIAYDQAVAQWQQAVGALAQVLSTIKDISQDQIQQLMKQLPPQPQPQQFGYNPQQQVQASGGAGSILQQVVTTTAQAGTSQIAGPQNG